MSGNPPHRQSSPSEVSYTFQSSDAYLDHAFSRYSFDVRYDEGFQFSVVKVL